MFEAMKFAGLLYLLHRGLPLLLRGLFGLLGFFRGDIFCAIGVSWLLVGAGNEIENLAGAGRDAGFKWNVLAVGQN